MNAMTLATLPVRLEALVFDWAGTLVDFGSFAPTKVFVDAFARFGVQISLEQARGPMGMGKWDHIRALCNDAAIARQYQEQFGRLPTDEDVTAIYERFLPMQLEKVAEYSQPIPGAIELLHGLRQRGLKLGSCSGYPAAVMQRVLERAEREGLALDYVVASDDVPRSRPAPAMALRNVVELGIADVAGCVKVDDTAPGVEEGRRAGMWTVGLLLSGNAAGLSLEQFLSLDEAGREAARDRARAELQAGAPHYLIDTVADLPPVLADIETRLAAGQRP
ncbi:MULTISPECIES: phosphonoacetaldehyde hydrolase [Bordetella]|uniref:Phosphonoacetaldehyde hydrolase n=7 Tax=Bordetella TaxID=517 RepID=PHNX_BORPE|nr:MULTISPECIES: phosphonoacetaldehyde hydrolase [Bordetella]Q7VWH8.1 RecName: Full=Phosphonoacetaldehyde hydrolase; Short=Phosphonatase; AltName: Full=Phosphonoacetaldehyde phosphonohydrolase [Bordetella pertussis Tohama I]Q7W7R1.1 RecName: Full=Phosphonoacetaldehyde hydrolase; Short=Phosphonatase; AltName: Full=Phosphonoacetaldehyde phosphonohydrolase [Bordetella parapertussis 12822]Q7WL48.1 RecName: Full=Phosphonoacetaldehyde hydrolase; Short=Phosphonatase; AltName: Full=Phosphonoacetaldehyde